MKFEISFDENIYNKQMDLLFDITWKKKSAYYKNAQYLGTVLIAIGIVLIFKRPNIFGIGYVFLFFGLSNFIPFLYYFFKIKKEYKKLNAAKIEEVEILKTLKSISIEFNDDAIVISTEGNLNSIKWYDCVAFILKEDNLIIIAKNHQPFTLGKDEVGSQNFEQIISFVKTKIKTEI